MFVMVVMIPVTLSDYQTGGLGNLGKRIWLSVSSRTWLTKDKLAISVDSRMAGNGKWCRYAPITDWPCVIPIVRCLRPAVMSCNDEAEERPEFRQF
jgi:hypothetical protein